MPKRRYALRLAYHGGAFRGFQRQPGLPTVQGALEDALSHLGSRVRVEPAARTDAGVHALSQVVTFGAPVDVDPAELRAMVNARTPDSILCVEAARAAPALHARASATSRTYVYLVGWPAPAELREFAWSLPDGRAFPGLEAPRLDLARAAAALALAVGEHDFGGFARPGEQTARRVRDPLATTARLLRAEILPAAASPLVAIVIEGRSFLRAMVRHLVGTVVTAAVGRAEPSRVAEILASPGSRYRGVRAPAWGLTLAKVSYPRSPFPGLPARTAPGTRGTPGSDPAPP